MFKHNVPSFHVWCCEIDVDVAHVASVLLRCYKYVIRLLHFALRDLNVYVAVDFHHIFSVDDYQYFLTFF
jgi:hypothetical protein